MTTTRNNKTHTNPDTQAATNQAARPAKRAQPAQPARSGKGAAASKRIRKNPASIARSEVEENEATSDREEGEASELEPISAADEEETPDRTQTQTSRAKPKKGVKTTFVTASDVKILKVLSHNNICELEQFLKRTGQNGEPDTTNIEESLFDILDGKFTHEAVEDHALWRQKPMLTWVIPHLKQFYPSGQSSCVKETPLQQVDKMKPHFLKLRAGEDSTYHTVAQKLGELFKTKQAQELSTVEVEAVITKLYKVMGEEEKHPFNPVAVATKNMIKAIGPRTLREFLFAFMEVFQREADRAMEALTFLVGNTRATAVLRTLQEYKPDKNKNNREQLPQQQPQQQQQARDQPRTNAGGRTLCHGCGRQHPGECTLRNHPDWNTENKPWVESTNGKKWAAKALAKDGHTLTILPWDDTLSNQKWDAPSKPASKGDRRENYSGNKRKRG